MLFLLAISGHAVNPMIQPWLSMLPLATLADLYQQQDRFDGHTSFRNAVGDLCSKALASAIEDNLLYFTEEGTLNFSGFTRKRLKQTFSAFQSDTAQPCVRKFSNGCSPVKNARLHCNCSQLSISFQNNK